MPKAAGWAVLVAVVVSGCLEMMQTTREELCPGFPAAPFPFTASNERSEGVVLTFAIRDGESQCPVTSQTLSLATRETTHVEVSLPPRDVEIEIHAVGDTVEFQSDDSFRPQDAIGYAIRVTDRGIDAGRIVA